jgi:glutaredoxin
MNLENLKIHSKPILEVNKEDILPIDTQEVRDIQEVPNIDNYEIDIYTLSGCGWCKKTKAILNDGNAHYNEFQLDDKIINDKMDIVLNDNGTAEDHVKVLQIFSFVYNNPELVDSIDTLYKGGKVEDIQNQETVNFVLQYFLDNPDLLPAWQSYLEAKDNHTETVRDPFTALVKEYHTGEYVPQMLVSWKTADGQYSAKEYFGGYGELSECVQDHGDLEHCFYSFSQEQHKVADLNVIGG